MNSFTILEHILPGQHIREHPHSLRGRQEGVVQLAIKQYIPLDRPSPVPENAVTIIGVHGNGSPKELFEPLWEHLYDHLKKRSVPLRAVWIADVSNQGASYVLNEDIQGDTTNWYDHSRDLLHMVNHFRDEMPRPIIGVGHSMGCAQLVQLAIMHPRLLSTLVLYEPVIFDEGVRPPVNPAKFVANRADLWATREAAEAALLKSLRNWDPRVVDRYLKFGIRPVPTRLYNTETEPNLPDSAVTLTTTRHQESWSYTTPNLEPESAGLDRLLLADWDPRTDRKLSFGRPECWSSMRNLPHLRPGVLWVFGGRSYLSSPESQDSKLRCTGTGVGGSGGAEQGMVKKAVLEDGTHTLVFEQVDQSAELGAEWVQHWFQGWLEDEKLLAGYQSKRSEPGMVKASAGSLRTAMMPPFSERPKGKL